MKDEKGEGKEWEADKERNEKVKGREGTLRNRGVKQ